MEVKTLRENCFAPSRDERVVKPPMSKPQIDIRDIIDDSLSMISRSLGVMSGWTLANIVNRMC